MASPLYRHVLNLRAPSGVPTGAAGGDLTGSYPNPSVTPTAKSKWTDTGTTLLPVSATNNVTIPIGSTTVVSVVVGSGTVKGGLGTDGTQTLLHANNGYAPQDATKSSWLLFLAQNADSMGIARRAPNAGAGVFTIPLQLDNAGNLTITGATAIKASGTTWANPSDPRLKEDIAPYARGLADILPLEPITYRLKADPDGPTCYGFDAAAVQPVFPECVTETTMKLSSEDAEETAGVLSFDMHPIVVTLVNAIKELAARVAALEAAASAE